MHNRWMAAAGLAGFLGVATGAFGAHGLKEVVSPELLAIFKTGSHYCQVHAVVLLVVGLISDRNPSAHVERTGWLLSVGILIFSGSLWLLVLTNVRWLGAITPIGGACLLLGWLHLGWIGLRKPEKEAEIP